MKKRILSALLLVALLVTGIPVMAISASESAGSTAANTTDYASLYVGAENGPAIAAPGAALLGVFTAFKGEENAYDLVNGKWHNKLDATGKTDATLRDNTTAGAWAATDFGGLTTGLKTYADYNTAGKNGIGMDFYAAWMDNANFTVEASAVYYGLNDPAHDGNYANTTALATYGNGSETFRLDVLHGEYEVLLTTVNSVRLYTMWRTEKCSVTWCSGANHTGRNTAVAYACSITGASNANTAKYAPGGNTVSITRDGYTYAVTYSNGASGSNGGVCTFGTAYTAETHAADMAKAKANTRFTLFNRAPADVYAVRVYNDVLTEAEKQYNHLIDLLGFYQIAIPAGTTVEFLQSVAASFAGMNFVYDTNGIGQEYTLNQRQLALLFEDAAKTDYASLYVGANGAATANGATLVGLFTAFRGETGAYDLENGKWFNKMDKSGATDAILHNELETLAWGETAVGNGGLTAGLYDETAYTAAKNKMYIDLNGAWVTANSFTVETLAVAYGIGDGTAHGYDQKPNIFGNNSLNNGINNFRIDLLHGEFTRGLKTGGNIRMNVLWHADKCGESYCNHSPNGRSYGFALAAGLGSGESQDGMLANYAPAGATFGVTKTYDEAAATYTYAMYYNNGGSKLCGNSGNNVYTVDEYNAAVAAYGDSTLFKMFNATTMDVYAIRVYNGILTSAEQQLNHLVDLLGFYQVELSDAITVADLQKIAPAFATTTFVYDSDSAKSTADYDAVKAALTAAVALNEELSAYDKLYVQDGLVGLFTAFGADSSANVTLGKWLNKVGTDAATLRDSYSEASWQTATKGGLTMNLTGTNYNNATIDNTGIVFANTYADLANFTIEQASVVVGSHNGVTGVGGHELISFQMDLLRGLHLPNLDATGELPVDHGINMKMVWRANTTAAWWQGERDAFVQDMYLANNQVAIGTTAAYTKATADGTVTYGVRYATGSTYKISGASYTAEEYANAILNVNDRMVMFGKAAMDVYAVRVYNRALTVAEQQRNHLVDLLAFYQVELPKSLTGAQLDSIAATYATTGFVYDDNGAGDDYTAVKAQLTGALKSFNINADVTAYDELYVQNGLVALYTAFGEQVSFDLLGGKWYDKVGDNDATIYNTASSSEARLTLGENGGLKIAITDNAYNSVAAGNKVGVLLSDDYMDFANFTVEQASIVYGVKGTAADGSAYLGNYAGDYESFRFGVLRANWFANYNAKDGGANGLLDWDNRQGDPWVGIREKTYRNAYTANGDVAVGYTMSVTKTALADGMVNGIYFNAAPMVRYSTNASITDFELTAEEYEANKAAMKVNKGWFTLFNGVPADAYAIRVYNRTLTDAEMKYNHFVDLLAFYQIDLADAGFDYSVLAAKYADTVFVLDDTGSKYKYSAIKAELQAAVDVASSLLVNKDAAVKVVEKNDVSYAAIRFTATIDKAVVKAHTVKEYGMIIAPKAYVDAAGAFTTQALTAYVVNNSVSADRAYLKVTADGYYSTEGDVKTIAGGFANFTDVTKEKNPEFAVVAYMVVTIDGKDVTLYGTYEEENCVRVSDVLDAALAEMDEADARYEITQDLRDEFGEVLNEDEDENAGLVVPV